MNHTPTPNPAPSFVYCLNTSTLAKHDLTLRQRYEVAARAGYHAIEPWVKELDAHVAAGGTLRDLRKLGEDFGLRVAGLIGFFEWSVDDDARRKAGLEECRRNMEQVAEIGGTQLAAPPWGVHAQGPFDLPRVTDRYRQLCELGDRTGVTPLIEFWGASKHLSTLSEAVSILLGANHPRAALLADVFHLHRGGSDYRSLSKLSPSAIGLFHVNDYPAAPNRSTLTDAQRVWPGHGVGNVPDVLRTLHRIGYTGPLSVELFNDAYYALPADQAAREGLEALKACVARV